MITAVTREYAMKAAVEATGFATSAIGCPCEAGIEGYLSGDETPDGRPGVSIRICASKKKLPEQVMERIAECVLTAATTSVFNGLPDAEEKFDIKIHFFGDKFESKVEIAKTLAAFGAFTEGVQLFASFAILMNFPRFNKMKGMGQIVSWSVRDETLHCLSVIRLFRTFVQENPEIWSEELRRDLYLICATIVEHEDAFIDLAFELGGVQGLDASQTKEYIRFIADRRLQQLGLEPLYNIEKNPLPWLDEMLNAVEHTNFFENRATEYSKASTAGTWEEAFADSVFTSPQPEGEIEGVRH